MRVLGVLVLVASACVVWVAGSPAVAAPMAFTVAPRVAATASIVEAAGGGCTSTVQVTVTGFLFPGPPSVVSDQTVPADANGNWSVEVPMPATPAFVIATCDGGSTAPIVIAPNDVDTGRLVPAGITDSQVVITTSPLVDGSEMAVVDLSGSVIAATTAVGGVATVSISRALGPAEVIVLALRTPDPGIALPYIPVAARVQLPLAVSPTLKVEPHVADAASLFTISGTCAGSPRIVVKGRPAGWYDPPPVYADITDLPPNSPFSVSLPMPVLPSTVQLDCSNGAVSESRIELVSPAAGDLVPLTPTADDGGYIVAIPKASTRPPLAAYTLAGAPVPLSVVADPPVTVRIEPAPGVAGVVILGVEELGENAEALQISRVQAWLVDLPDRVAAPTTTIAPPVTAAPTTAPPPQTAPASTGNASATLPSVGSDIAAMAAAAAGCLAAGCAMLTAARRRHQR